MPTVAFHTLGCKVNQYDSQAMLELFMADGFEAVSFDSPADIYVINTCTVTGTGDKKSLQLARRVKRDHPDALLILCGCMAQKQGGALLSTGADLILGTQYRGEIVSLAKRLLVSRSPLCAVSPLLPGMPFENLTVSRHEGHTRAAVKIQEGCDNRCTYCIIPSVRGPIRSRPLEDIRSEIFRLRDAGFVEIVLTGIHLASYGKDFPGSRPALLDVIRAVHSVPGILRVRIGSLEPVVSTEEFCRALKDLPGVCPQFHLALQSGSDTVLARMKRRYNTAMYLHAVDQLRSFFPDAALTTDILTGFPGESQAEFEETKAFIEKVGFSRIHVFPYSQRADTPAAVMPGQLSSALKEERARELISLGKQVAEKYLSSWIGRESVILPEEKIDGCWEGYTPEYIRVTLPPDAACKSGIPCPVRLVSLTHRGMSGMIIE